MHTEIIKIDMKNIDLNKIKLVAEAIKKGAVVAIPTETVYGLAANFFNKQAVERIFRLKKRPKNKPLPVQIKDISYLEELTGEISTFAYQLMNTFWPGPLTLVVPAKDGGTIGLRIPDNKIAQSVIEKSQTPLVVPSANLSGAPPATTATEVLQTFDGRIEMVIDAGKVKLGVASTVVDLSVSPYRILRESAISSEDIRRLYDKNHSYSLHG
jgi:L-threonylcarbamoyladenylate synthase